MNESSGWADGRKLNSAQRARKRRRDRERLREKKEYLMKLEKIAADLNENCPKTTGDSPADSQASTSTGSSSEAEPNNRPTSKEGIKKFLSTVVPKPPNPIKAILRPENYDLARFFNRLVIAATKPGIRNQIIHDETIFQDFLIRAVMVGWKTTGKGGVMCPLWRLLEIIDLWLFQDEKPHQRIIMLKTIHDMWMSMIKAKPIPDWYQPLPMQKNSPHEPVIDYFAWPELRTRFVYHNLQYKTSYLTNEFWWTFSRCALVEFDYPTEEMIVWDSDSDLYYCHPAFSMHIRNINSWKISDEFYQKFSDLFIGGQIKKQAILWEESEETEDDEQSQDESTALMTPDAKVEESEGSSNENLI